MVKKTNEIIQRINSWYVGDDCVQVMVPYKNAITILDKNGIMYHHKEGSNIFINNYVTDVRRKQFPYHTIPTHYTKFAFDGLYHYTNQLFEFEQPYIRINDGNIIESYVIKDKNEALTVNKVIPIYKSEMFKTRKEIEEIFEEPSNENDKVYYLDINGGMVRNNKKHLTTEEEICNYVKDSLRKNVSAFREYILEEPSSRFTRYLQKNEFFLDYVEKSIDKFNLNDHVFDLGILGDATMIIFKTNGIDISLQGVDVYFISPDCYRVATYDIPLTKYTLEQLKFLTSKIIETKEPRITLSVNPGVTKNDIKREKRLVLEKKRLVK